MWAYVHGNIFVVVAEGGATCQWEELISFFVGISDVNNNTEPFRAGPICRAAACGNQMPRANQVFELVLEMRYVCK